MPLVPGTRLSIYEIVALIGKGDPDRVKRFEREARILAALNHPHIATIHGVEDAQGTAALVMELVDGETLGERITRGPLPIPVALRLASQIAEALVRH